MSLQASLDGFLDALKRHYIAFVPALLAYLLASPASLRLFLAAQASPVLDVDPEPRSRKTRALVVGVSAILSVVGLGCILLLHAITQTVDDVLMCGIALAYVLATVSFFNTVTGLTKWVVHRNTHGVPICLPMAREHNCRLFGTKLLVSASAIAITASAFLKEHPFSIAITSLALIYNMCCSNPGANTLSISGMFIAFLALAGTSLLAGGVSIAVMLHLNLGADFPPFEHGVIEKIARILHTFTVLKMWWFIPVYASLTGWLITLALRFDYQRHTASFEPPYQFIYFAIPAPTCSGWYKRSYSDGIVIPSKLPVEFPKVYYTTVLVAWGLVQFTLVCLSAFTPLSLEGVYDFSAVAMVIELPVMFVALMVVALARGEWETMWNYQEVWVIKSLIRQPSPVSRRTQ